MVHSKIRNTDIRLQLINAFSGGIFKVKSFIWINFVVAFCEAIAASAKPGG